MGDDYGLLPELALDAVLARADRGELELATPRLLDLVVGHSLSIEQAADVVARLAAHDWSSSQRVAVEETLDAWWLETLMRRPGEHDFPYTPDVVLGVLAGYDAPMIRWFDPWLAELDGPGSLHLAAVVLGRPVLGHDQQSDDQSADSGESRPVGSGDSRSVNSGDGRPAPPRAGAAVREIPAWAQTPPSPVVPTGPAWAGKQDQASQVIAWAKSETVVHGLALIGATHLDPEVMSDLLDRLI